MRIQRAAEHRRVTWHNGRGVTSEIATGGSAHTWDWRLSLATVDIDGPFSSFCGVDRQIVIVEGAGMVLDVNGRPVDCRPLEVVRFDGAAATSARLVAGPVRDLNLMTRRGASTATMEIVDASTGAIDVATSDIVVALQPLTVELDRDAIHDRQAAPSLDLAQFDAMFEPGPGRLVGGLAAIIVIQLSDEEHPR